MFETIEKGKYFCLVTAILTTRSSRSVFATQDFVKVIAFWLNSERLKL